MRRRDVLKYAGAAALAAPFVRVAHAEGGAIKVGVVGAKTGPLAPGAAATHFPPWRLWAHEINQAGGLKLKDGARKVELIEYDDRTQPPEAIKAIERLATVDKADWIVGLYSTGFNIAAVPTFTKLGYPQIAVACVTDLGEQLVKKNPRLFFANGTITQYTSSAIDVLKKLKEGGQLGNKVALVNVADEFGIEASNISKKLLPAAGFEIVYDKSYPLGTQDYTPVIKAVKSSNPDAFIAWSYPPVHVRLDRSGQDRKPECEGLLQRHRLRLCGLLRQIRRLGGKHHRLRRHPRQRKDPAPSSSSTRRSPASIPTTMPARTTTRMARFCGRRSRAPAAWIGMRSPSI
jgi:branched-chain amino acid transport system substrate-binding protein